MVEAQCHCRAVRVAIEALPAFINDCNCSLCRKSGAAWGYFTARQVRVEGETSVFMRSDKDQPAVQIHVCPRCHTTTHWTLTEDFQVKAPDPGATGVNMRLFASNALLGVEIRFPDGAAWSGEGDYGYRRPSFVVTTDAQL